MNEVSFPLVAGTRELASKFGMLDPDEIAADGMPLTARCVSTYIMIKYSGFNLISLKSSLNNNLCPFSLNVCKPSACSIDRRGWGLAPFF